MKIAKHISILVLSLALSLQSYAWGGYEHTVIAYAAQYHLTERTERNIRYYLDQPIYEYAEWMDYTPMQEYEEYRHIGKFGHMVAVGKNGELPERSPLENGQAALYPCLKDVMYILENHRSMPDSLVVLNLRYIIHMIGDMHCPGHILYLELPSDGTTLPVCAWTENRIWEKCWYKGSRQTIHWLWDTALQHEHGDWNFQQWKDYMDIWSAEEIESAVAGPVQRWIKESADVCDSIFEYSFPEGKYDESYYSGRALELSHLQIRRAIYRLAKVLNDCFDHE